jgi:hypothetical protein
VTLGRPKASKHTPERTKRANRRRCAAVAAAVAVVTMVEGRRGQNSCMDVMREEEEELGKKSLVAARDQGRSYNRNR